MIYIACAYATVYLIYMKFRATYDGNHDSFRVEFLVVPVGGLAVLINHDFSFMEVGSASFKACIHPLSRFAMLTCKYIRHQILWTFSIYLESVAILPQLFMISKTGEAETITTHYLFCLGLYRALYIFNWVWRFYFEGFFDLIAIVAGVVQTILYCDFFYLYVTKGGFAHPGRRLCGLFLLNHVLWTILMMFFVLLCLTAAFSVNFTVLIKLDKLAFCNVKKTNLSLFGRP